MRLTSILLSTCAAICLTWPVGAFAAPPDDRGAQADQQPKKDKKGGDQPSAAAGKKEAAPGASAKANRGVGGPDKGAATAANPAKARAQESKGQGQGRQADRAPTAQVNTPPNPAAERRATPAAPREAPARPASVERRTPSAVPQTYQAQRPTPQARPAPAPAPALSAWRAPARGPERDRAVQQWRQDNQGWDRSARWHESSDWWRGDSSFRLFLGPRVGFYFIPEVGYRAVPKQYRSRHWQAGDYLPTWFRAYVVRNYRHYGLPRPPSGCVWIWLNGDVALIHRSDGYVLDVVRNVW